MLQLVYISSATPGGDHTGILPISRANNRRDGITGLLYSDGVRFLQALEGPADIVEAAYARIAADPRHRALVVLSRRTIATREFGQWAMAERRPDEEGTRFLARVEQMVAGAAPNVRATFEGFTKVRRAA